MNPAETYERYFVPAMFVPWATILLRHAALQSGERLLDLACGTGAVTRRAAPLLGSTGTITALDLNPAMLAVARSLPKAAGASVTWQQGSAQALPFADSSFDVAVCQHGLQFFPDRLAAIRELWRVLRPDGRAAVIVLQSLSQHPVFEALIQAVARALPVPLSAVDIPFALSSAAELESLFVDAGFRDVHIHAESTQVHFAEPERFVELAVTSSAAAVPAFATLEAQAKTSVFDAVRQETEAVVRAHRSSDSVSFPMFAHVAVARR